MKKENQTKMWHELKKNKPRDRRKTAHTISALKKEHREVSGRSLRRNNAKIYMIVVNAENEYIGARDA